MPLEKTKTALASDSLLTITALGDSLTYGWMVDKAYLDYLQEMLYIKYPSAEIRIFNRGVPGDTAEGGKERLKRDVINTRPDLALIQFGLNDAFCGYNIGKFKNNILAIIRGIKEGTDSEIILMTAPALYEDDMKIVEPYYMAISEAGQEENIEVAMVHEYWSENISEGITFKSLVQSDGVHPTEKGYSLIAEAIMQHL